MTNSRNKGASGERSFAKYLNELGYHAKRGQQHNGLEGRDVVCEELDPLIHWEIKRVERLNYYDAVDQAKRDCPEGKWRVVGHRKNGKEWLATLPMEDFMDIVKENIELRGMQ